MQHTGATIFLQFVELKYLFRYLNGDCDSAEFGELLKAVVRDQSQNLSQIAFSNLMNKFVVSGLDLLNYHDSKDIVKFKLAGLIIFDRLIDINDEIMPERRIEISNHIFKVLENDKLSLATNEIILRTAALSIGHFARVASSSEAEFLQNFSFPLALKLLRDTKSDSHKFAGALILTQLAQNSPTLIFSKQKQVFAEVCEIVSDKNYMVRSSAALALESVLKVIAQRESMGDYIRLALKQVDTALNSSSAEKIIGGLIILDTVIKGSIISMSEVHSTMRQFAFHPQDLIWKVLSKKDAKDAEVKQFVLDLLPTLARAFSGTFLQPNSCCPPYTFLNYSVKFLIEAVAEKRERTAAFTSLGKLHSALSNHFRTSPQIQNVFEVICLGLRDPFSVEALDCLGVLVAISPPFRKLIDSSTVDAMFRGGLSKPLVETLKVVTKHVPSMRNYALRLLLRDISKILSNKAMFLEERKRQLDNKSVKDKQKWNAGPTHLFGGSKVETLSSESNSTISKTTEELIFALSVLCEPEFFPKYYREKNIASVEEDQTKELLAMLRDCVVRYLDDINSSLRKAAALACATIVNTVVVAVDPSKSEFFLLHQTIERLLVMGVGDDAEEIRTLVFSSITPALDEAIARTGYAHCLIEALNDESLSVRASAMTVLARVARFDTLHIMPVIGLEIKRLLFNLNLSMEYTVKQESVRILQSLVRGSDFLIVPYVDQMVGPLLVLLKDPFPEVVSAALSTIGELASASPECVREHLDSLAPRLIEALNDQTSVIKQETAVIAMGKLVSSFSIVTAEPYKKYSGLFEGLVRAAQNSEDRSVELRLQAIKTLGLLGAVDAAVYQHHLTCINPARGAFNTPLDFNQGFDGEDFQGVDHVSDIDETENGSESEKKLSQTEKMYFSLIVNELMNILKDSNLAYYHLLAAGVAVKTIRILGAESAFRVDKVIEGLFYRLYQSDAGNNIKEALLDHVTTLVLTLGSKVKKHNTFLIQLIKDFFESHCQLCLDLLEALGISYSTPDFTVILNEILPFLSRYVDADLHYTTNLDDLNDVAVNKSTGTMNIKQSYSKNPLSIQKILQKFVNLNEFLGSYRRDVLPVILSVLDNAFLSVELRKEALLCLLNVANDKDLQEFCGRVVRPTLRLFSVADLKTQQVIVTALSSIVCRLGSGYIPYIVPVKRKLSILSTLKENNGKLPKLEEYESLIARLLKQRPLPSEPSDISSVLMKNDEKIKIRMQNTKSYTESGFQINVQSLETAWALADRNNASNLVEWMSRFTNELIRQSPSSTIRSCAVLANTYRPLAEALFNISFYCVWNDLFSSQMSEVLVDASLISGIEMALQSPEIPKPIMISLLNLTEFMDIHDLPLPIDIKILAKQAQAANMFAKCLRYRELEFKSKNVKPSFECIDALIAVCNQLGLADRAIGILRYLRQEFPEIEIQPQWLEKLCRWDDAQKSYELGVSHYRSIFKSENPTKHEAWMNTELGRLRCLHALGEYEDVLAGSKTLRAQIKLADEAQDNTFWASLAEVQRLGSYAAWMLAKWDTMEELLEGETRGSDIKDVVLWNHIDFFKAVLAIHQQDYTRASGLISEIRNSLSNSISSLLSESYARAYRAMVTMQILAEMEEIVEFKQMVERLSLDHESRTDSIPDKLRSLNFQDTNIAKISNADISAKKISLITKWRGRLKWAPKDIEVYRQILVKLFEHVQFVF
jgi:FKBP12-rapamycin complex-associated protein